MKVRPARSKKIAFIVSETPEVRQQEATYTISSTSGNISIVNHKNEYVAYKQYNIPLSITKKNSGNKSQSHRITVELYFL
ncbi:hypothetical protein AAGU66_06605 [Edwardsiella ictaluri]|uniref:hypothetical protein n=1 Tax=Edwardsiella ictaluri TaxID=67780 RepID=UPI0012DC936A|nr:hypothetical protein [Edwardsiella ictaluri]EKS7764803.1 hypothetical protein [Edwardsiella ictaluri]EKS7771704.1 hypothetical protein [Edwardsiella ictaluri]EKS7774884.1 hypothetical protein [Edwardsiella ictaluri]EKS7791590.1 hypothetical protein [Edwardsiella ictaluri]EKS7798229.1 hypothetical protein [Edwardsiella ictaluri]